MHARWRAMDFKRQLEGARTDDLIVRVHRSGLEDGWVDGRVAALGPEFLMLEILDKGQRPDGFNCLRYSDITQCDVPAPHAKFLQQAIAARRLSWSAPPSIDLSSPAALLLSAQTIFPLVTIHLEGDEECGICLIGKVAHVEENKIDLREISPDAEWDEKPTSYNLAEITRVDFGGAYEESLHLVSSAR